MHECKWTRIEPSQYVNMFCQPVKLQIVRSESGRWNRTHFRTTNTGKSRKPVAFALFNGDSEDKSHGLKKIWCKWCNLQHSKRWSEKPSTHNRKCCSATSIFLWLSFTLEKCERLKCCEGGYCWVIESYWCGLLVSTCPGRLHLCTWFHTLVWIARTTLNHSPKLTKGQT